MTTHAPTTSRPLRWGGLAAVLGSLLVMVGAYWGKYLEAGGELHEFTAEPAFLGAVVVGMLGALLLVFGAMSLATAQLGSAGAWGPAGLVGGVTAAVMLLAGLFAQGTFFPSLANDAPEFLQLLAAGEASGPVGPAILVSSLLQSIGLIVFGIATIRADVFSSWAGAALIAGAVLIAIPFTGSNLLLFAALIWMGWRLFRDAGPRPAGPADQPTRERRTAPAGRG